MSRSTTPFFCRQRDELGVLGEEIVKPRVDVEPELDRLSNVGPRFLAQTAAVGREPDHEVGRASALVDRPPVGCPEIGFHRDSGRTTIQHLTGVLAGVSRVDHRQHSVSLRAADQTVGGLAVGRGKRALAVDDCVSFGKSWILHQRLPVRITT